MLLVAMIGCLCGGGLALRGHHFVGGVVGLAAVWCEVHHSLLTATDFPSPGLLATSVLLVAAILLYRPRHAVLVSVACIGLAWPAVLLSPAVQATGITPVVIDWLTVHAAVTLAVGGLVAVALSTVDHAFAEVLSKEQALSETINKAPDGILVLDADSVVQVANPAAEALLGLHGDACRGLPIADVIRAAGTEQSAESHPSAANTDERPRTWVLQRADGHRVELEVTWRTMDAGRRQLVLRDISERSRAEEARRELEGQLAHAQRLEAVGQLAGGIAHDFNNILTIVGASAEVLRADLHDDRYAPLLDEILAAQERGATLTRQLLAFARREVVQPTVFDLSAQVLTLRPLLQRLAGEQVRILCDVEPECRIRADVGQLEQALVNLVSNACDAMPNGGACRLSVVRMTNDDGQIWVRLRVTDAGLGMDAATQARAFEPFFTTKSRGRGTGLGLASVHGMAIQSGGRADIESRLGRGTTVVLEFPFATAPVTEPEVDTTAERPGHGATILVAEDDDGTRATVARMLARLGHTVLLAPDGHQALRLAQQHAGHIDLLLTDVMMPGMSGPQLAAQLKQRALTLPVLYMSGYPEDALSEADGLRLETDFVAKPFTSAVLARKISDKLGLSIAQR
jgi:PAS domain S-box-containing protein